MYVGLGILGLEWFKISRLKHVTFQNEATKKNVNENVFQMYAYLSIMQQYNTTDLGGFDNAAVGPKSFE